MARNQNGILKSAFQGFGKAKANGSAPTPTREEMEDFLSKNDGTTLVKPNDGEPSEVATAEPQQPAAEPSVDPASQQVVVADQQAAPPAQKTPVVYQRGSADEAAAMLDSVMASQVEGLFRREARFEDLASGQRYNEAEQEKFQKIHITKLAALHAGLRDDFKSTVNTLLASAAVEMGNFCENEITRIKHDIDVRTEDRVTAMRRNRAPADEIDGLRDAADSYKFEIDDVAREQGREFAIGLIMDVNGARDDAVNKLEGIRESHEELPKIRGNATKFLGEHENAARKEMVRHIDRTIDGMGQYIDEYVANYSHRFGRISFAERRELIASHASAPQLIEQTQVAAVEAAQPAAQQISEPIAPKFESTYEEAFYEHSKNLWTELQVMRTLLKSHSTGSVWFTTSDRAKNKDDLIENVGAGALCHIGLAKFKPSAAIFLPMNIDSEHPMLIRIAGKEQVSVHTSGQLSAMMENIWNSLENEACLIARSARPTRATFQSANAELNAG